MMITDTQIKGIFLDCNNKNPDGLYADDVDLLEFGRKLEEMARKESATEERDACIKFVRSLNVEVAKALEDWRKWTDRSQ
jgi:hypothetical protein